MAEYHYNFSALRYAFTWNDADYVFGAKDDKWYYDPEIGTHDMRSKIGHVVDLYKVYDHDGEMVMDVVDLYNKATGLSGSINSDDVRNGYITEGGGWLFNDVESMQVFVDGITGAQYEYDYFFDRTKWTASGQFGLIDKTLVDVKPCNTCGIKGSDSCLDENIDFTVCGVLYLTQSGDWMMTDFDQNPSASQMSGTRFVIKKPKDVDNITINWILGSQGQTMEEENFSADINDIPMGFAVSYGDGVNYDGSLIDVKWIFDPSKNGTTNDWNNFGGHEYEAATYDNVTTGSDKKLYSLGNVEASQILCVEGDCYIIMIPRQYDRLFDAGFRKDKDLLTFDFKADSFDKFYIYYYVVPEFDISAMFNTYYPDAVLAEDSKEWEYIPSKLANHIDLSKLEKDVIEVDMPKKFKDYDLGKGDVLFPPNEDRVRIGGMKIQNDTKKLFLTFGYEKFIHPTELWYMGDIEVQNRKLSLSSGITAMPLMINPGKVFGDDEYSIDQYRIESFDILPSFGSESDLQFVLGFDSDFDKESDISPNNQKKMYQFVKVDPTDSTTSSPDTTDSTDSTEPDTADTTDSTDSTEPDTADTTDSTTSSSDTTSDTTETGTADTTEIETTNKVQTISVASMLIMILCVSMW